LSFRQEAGKDCATTHPLSCQPTPEWDLIENSRRCAQLQLFAGWYFPPQLVEEVQQKRQVRERLLTVRKERRERVAPAGNPFTEPC
jgi:hypothetical protein